MEYITWIVYCCLCGWSLPSFACSYVKGLFSVSNWYAAAYMQLFCKPKIQDAFCSFSHKCLYSYSFIPETLWSQRRESIAMGYAIGTEPKSIQKGLCTKLKLHHYSTVLQFHAWISNVLRDWESLWDMHYFMFKLLRATLIVSIIPLIKIQCESALKKLYTQSVDEFMNGLSKELSSSWIYPSSWGDRMK